METDSRIYKFAARFLAVVIVAMGVIALPLFLASCGGDQTSTSTQLTCFNNGDGTQVCNDGNGNITNSPCTTVNGSLVTSTGQSCDASTSETTNPPPS